MFSDEQVASRLPGFAMTRALLGSATNQMGSLLGHVNQIEASTGDRERLLRYYLDNPSAVVIDGIATGRILTGLPSERRH